MKSFMNWQSYHAVSRADAPQSSKNSLGIRLTDLKERVLAYFVASSEPHIWTTEDAQGHTHWKAFDPATNQFVDWLSEEELRVWLEKRHHINSWYARV